MKLQKEYKDQGFVIVAQHAQAVDKDKVVSFLRKNKVNFTVTSGGGVDVPNQPRSIPRAYLFDSKGELIDQGHPMQLKNDIPDLIASEPHYLAAGRDYQEIGKIAAMLKRTKAYGSILDKLDKEIKKGGDAGDEAKYLAGRIRDHGKQRFMEARKLESDDAFAAMTIYKELERGYKGHKAGDKSKERTKELKKDKEFQKELKAGEIAAKIDDECSKLVTNATQDKPVLTSGSNKKIASKVYAMARVLFGKYGDTNAAARTKTVMKSYGFKI